MVCVNLNIQKAVLQRLHQLSRSTQAAQPLGSSDTWCIVHPIAIERDQHGVIEVRCWLRTRAQAEVLQEQGVLDRLRKVGQLTGVFAQEAKTAAGLAPYGLRSLRVKRWAVQLLPALRQCMACTARAVVHCSFSTLALDLALQCCA